MWDTDCWDVRSSYVEPVADPGTAPGDHPMVCLSINVAWVPYVLGALTQLAQARAWAVLPSALPDLLGRVQDLIALIGGAGSCLMTQYGSVSILIPAGEASAGQAVVFPVPYAAPPVVGVASGDGKLHAWFADVTVDGFTVNLDADTGVVADTTGAVDWWVFG